MITDLFTKKSKEIARLQAAQQLSSNEIASLKAENDAKANEIAKVRAEMQAKLNELTEKNKAIEALKIQEEQLQAIKSAMGGSSSAVMMVNRDFIVTYVNQASIDLFTSAATQFKAVFPNFDHTKIIGTCIDVFHKNPQHQRQMLADTSRLPFKTDIRVGDLIIALYVTATYNASGQYTGNVLEWRDVTAQRRKAMEDLDAVGKLAALNRAQGVIEFDLTGNITAVNENFAKVTGYSEHEIVGKHHSMFVAPEYKTSLEYKEFWEKLARGEAGMGRYKRIAKGGREIWIQATYNPILDGNGKPFKVVKYASDITEQQKEAESLTNAVVQTQAIIEAAKAGDLSSRVPLEGKSGAIASLCDGVNALMDKMTEIIVQVREAGETINTAAGEISSGNTDLSKRTEQQASSLEQTASSMEELASTVKQNSENAKQANQLAVAASGVAVKGGTVVNQVTTTMLDINASSRKIVDIISVIDGIAFQTNILALNAAVEAARAGEQGRGFAVVAGEVRNLAQRSASAAKEIKGLISDSVAKVDIGSKLVEDAGKTMGEIVSSVQRVTDIMGEITAASIEQSAGIDQVNDAVTKMDEATQQNAALVEQAAAAAESLVEQSTSLMETVSAFQLSGGPGLQRTPNLRTVKAPAQIARGSAQRPLQQTVTAVKKPVIRAADDADWTAF